MSGALYVETSAALRAVLEAGTTPALEQRIAAASVLITSRLSLVEAVRAMLRLRARGVWPRSAWPTRGVSSTRCGHAATCGSRRIAGIELETTDERLADAAGAAPSTT